FIHPRLLPREVLGRGLPAVVVEPHEAPERGCNGRADDQESHKAGFPLEHCCLQGDVKSRTPDEGIVVAPAPSGNHPMEVAVSLKGGNGGGYSPPNGSIPLFEAGFVERPAAPRELLLVPVAQLGERDSVARGLDEPAVPDVDRGMEDLRAAPMSSPCPSESDVPP